MWNIECSNINSNVSNLYSFCSIKKGFCSSLKCKMFHYKMQMFNCNLKRSKPLDSNKKWFCSKVKFRCSITLFGFLNKECVYSNVEHRIFLSIMKMFQFQLKRFKPFLVSNMLLLLQWKKIVTVTFFAFLILHTLILEMCEMTSVGYSHSSFYLLR